MALGKYASRLVVTSQAQLLTSETELPKQCKKLAAQENLDPYNMTVYDVLYEDCPQPWVICHHHLSQNRIESIADNFGRVPIGLRNFIRIQLG